MLIVVILISSSIFIEAKNVCSDLYFFANFKKYCFLVEKSFPLKKSQSYDNEEIKSN